MVLISLFIFISILVTILHIVSHFIVIQITHEVVIELLFYYILLPLNLFFLSTFWLLGKFFNNIKQQPLISINLTILIILTLLLRIILNDQFSLPEESPMLYFNQLISIFFLLYPIFLLLIILLRRKKRFN
jgi:hypothetical protein